MTRPPIFRRPPGFPNTSIGVSTWSPFRVARDARASRVGAAVGRRDPIAAGQRAISPHHGIGRGMKVGKEEIVGLLAAVERFLKLDHDAEWRDWEAGFEMIDLLAGIPGMNATRRPEIANHAPHVVLEWSPWHDAPLAAEVVRLLRAGEPPIAVLAEGERTVRVAVWTCATMSIDRGQKDPRGISRYHMNQYVCTSNVCLAPDHGG